MYSLVKAIAPFRDRADRTVVTGQSFGGLSALYAGLHWPETLWLCIKPVRDRTGGRIGRQEGVLREKLEAGEVGAKVCALCWKRLSRADHYAGQSGALSTIRPIKESIFWRQVDSRHDALCWRGGLMQGLIDLWQPLFHETS
ncbi:hypothetical protein ACNKHX_03050 [Shigella flexneri]